jgi:hypothetical protein
MITYLITAINKVAAEPIRCIPNAPLVGGGTAITLCGWVDVPYTEEVGEPNCFDCLEIVAYCKGIES